MFQTVAPPGISSLTADDLVDDLHLFVNPVAIGEGMPVFGRLDAGPPP